MRAAQQLRLVVRDPPGGLPDCRCCSRMGTSHRRGGGRSCGSSWTFVVLLGLDLALGSEDADGLGRIGLDREPVLHRRRRAAPDARPADRHLPSRRSSRHPSCRSSFGSGVRPASSVSRSSGWCSDWAWRSSGSPPPASTSQETIVTALIGGAAFLLFPLSIGIADPALPPLRPRRRGAQDPDLRRVRALRHADLPRARGRRRRLAGPRQLVPHDGRGGGRGAHVPAGARAAHAVRQPARLRQARDAVRGAVGVLRTRRWRVRRRGRAAADGADPGRGHRRRARRRVARGRPGAPRRRGLARTTSTARADRRCRTASVPHDRRAWIACTRSSAGGRAAGRARGPQAGERSGVAVGREADRRPRRRRPGSCSATSADRGAQGTAGRPEGRAEAAGLRAGRRSAGGSSATSTTARSSSWWRSPSSSSSPTA